MARFLTTVVFRHGRTTGLAPARANGQLAFGAYPQDPRAGTAHANGLLVLTLTAVSAP